MRKGRTAGDAAAAAAVLLAATAGALAGPASAGAALPTYTVAAGGRGVELGLGGTTLAGAGSSVSAGTGAPVTAQGQGEVSPEAAATAQASEATPGATQTRPRTCAQPTSPFPSPLETAVSLGAACAAASATLRATGMPAASGDATIASLAVGPPPGGTATAALGSLLPASVTQGSGLAQALQTVLGSLPGLPATGLPLGTVLQKVAAATSSTVSSLVSASFGPSTSTIAVTGPTVTATSADTGATIQLLDGLGAGGGALLTVTAGRATAAAHADLAASSTTAVGATATAGAVTVAVDPPVGPSKRVSVAPGQSQRFLTGTPLQTTVSVGAPSVTTAHGTSSASGVTIDMAQGSGLGGIGAGGIVLTLGSATAHATVTFPPPVVVAPAPPTAPSVPAVLTGATTVHTGEPWSGPLPFALLGLSLLAGIGLLARRRLAAVMHLAGRTAARSASAAGPASPHAAGPGLRDLLRSPSGSGPGPAVRSPSAPSPGPPGSPEGPSAPEP